jgi:hypothetical protein
VRTTCGSGICFLLIVAGCDSSSDQPAADGAAGRDLGPLSDVADLADAESGFAADAPSDDEAPADGSDAFAPPGEAGTGPDGQGLADGRDASGASDVGGYDAGALPPPPCIDAGTCPPPPHVVRPCPSGPAAVGVWEQINPPGVPIPPPSCNGGPCDYGTKAPLVDPLNRAIVYLGTDHHGVFKSKDCGATWNKVSTGRNGTILDTGGQWSMQMDPVDTRILYANNGYGRELGVWKSINGGVDWDQLMPPGSFVATNTQYNFASIISMDPTDRTHLVVSYHESCAGIYMPGCLAETKDSGATWRLIKLPVGGAEAAGVALVNARTWLFGVPFNGLWVTTDGGASWNKAANDGGYNLFRSANGTYFLAGNGILRSTDALTWTRVPSNAYSVMGDGLTLFASPRYCSTNCYSTSPETDGNVWTALKTPVTGHGAVNLVYDPDHHILYSSNETGGFWRVVTR